MPRARPARFGEFWLVLFIGVGMLAGALVGLFSGLALGASLDRFWICVLGGMGVGALAGLVRARRVGSGP